MTVVFCIDICKLKSDRSLLSKFRLSAHSLAIEKVHYSNIERQKRVCLSCDAGRFRLRKPRVLEAFPIVWLMCFVQVRSLLMVTPRYFPLSAELAYINDLPEATS
jgi:hypothetical protein